VRLKSVYGIIPKTRTFQQAQETRDGPDESAVRPFELVMGKGAGEPGAAGDGVREVRGLSETERNKP